MLDVCLWVYTGCPETGGIGSYELPDVDAGTQASCKSSIFSPAPNLVFKDYQNWVGSSMWEEAETGVL